MTQIIYSVRGEIGKRDIPFYKRYKHAEKTLIISAVTRKQNSLVVNYQLDYLESIWFSQEDVLNNFPFMVVSGCWYGGERGGRLRAKKRTYGAFCFEGVEIIEENKEFTSRSFIVAKPRFTKQLNISFSSKDVGTWEFNCKGTLISPSNRTLLLNADTNNYEDMTDYLSGLDFKE